MYDNIFCLFVKGVETVDESHFITSENIERLKQAKEANRIQVCLLYYVLIKDKEKILACYVEYLVHLIASLNFDAL